MFRNPDVSISSRFKYPLNRGLNIIGDNHVIALFFNYGRYCPSNRKPAGILSISQNKPDFLTN